MYLVMRPSVDGEVVEKLYKRNKKKENGNSASCP